MHRNRSNCKLIRMDVHLPFDTNTLLENLEIEVIHAKASPFSLHILKKYTLSICKFYDGRIFNNLLNLSHLLIKRFHIN